MTESAQNGGAERIVIVGAGHAGGSVAAMLRQYGHRGSIMLVGEEAVPPYQRPPLSKAFLKGDADVDDLLLRPSTFYKENDLDLRTGLAASRIDRSSRRLHLSVGRAVEYDRLILATGAAARRLDLPGEFAGARLELRTIQDAIAIKQALRPGIRLAIIGGGYVGAEAAASARALGAEATILEAGSRLLQRVASEPVSGFVTRLQESNGVKVLTGIQAASLEPSGIRLTDGNLIEADAILVGIGATPRDALAQQAGLNCHDGVVVDGQGLTSDPSIYAIGDMTSRPVPFTDRHHRIESVPSALEQAKQVASAITGRPAPPLEAPWFWSDQYHVKLQTAGTLGTGDRLLLRGSPEDERFSVFHLADDTITCVESINAPADFMGGRQLISRGLKVDIALLSDPTVSMKDLSLP